MLNVKNMIFQPFRSASLNLLRTTLLSAVAACAIASPSYADDTEIFFGQSKDAFETNPNILFVLDNSGSMNSQDGGTVSRLDQMKNAMRLLLDQSSNFNVGIMAFQGRRGGASVRYPIGDLDTDSSSLCTDGICPNETVIVRPRNSSDDAVQNDESLEVILNNQHLIMGTVTPQDITDAELGTTTAATSATDPSDKNANLITKTYLSSISVQESVQASDGVFTWQNNQLADRWFFKDSDSREPLYGYQFKEVDIPAGATITSASIEFSMTGSANQAGEVAAYIAAEQTAVPPEFPANGSSADATGVVTLIERNDLTSRTNEIVAWNSIPGTIDNPSDNGLKLTTPNVANIANELVNLPSWESGNTMSFLFSPQDSYVGSNENVREIFSGGAIEANQPKLTIVYEETVTNTVQVTTSTSLNHIDEYTMENTGQVNRNTTNEVSQLFHAGVGNKPRQIALRFPNIDIPEGATISSANLTLRLHNAESSVSPDSDWLPVISTQPADLSVPPPDGDPGTGTGTGTGTDVGAAGGSGTVVKNLAININAELSADPTADAATPINERPLTTDFIAWSDVPDEAGTDIISPNLSVLIDSVLTLDDWEVGNTVSLVLSAPGDYNDIPVNIREILTGASDYKPVLDIRWTKDNVSNENTPVSHTTAVRFRNVHVPPGATIKSAEIILHAAAPSGEAASFDLSGEAVANTAPFELTNNDIGSRQRTTARETWDVEPWTAVGNEYTSVDITSIVSEITNQTDWCGGNPLSVFIKGTGNRFAQSVEANASEAPALRIEYALDTVPEDGYCSNSSVLVSVSDGSDDGVEDASGNMALSNTYLATNHSEGSTEDHTIGLRFRGLQLPLGAVITSATLEMTAAADMTDDISATIAVEDSDNSGPYVLSNPATHISARSYTGSINWAQPGNIATGDSLFSSDITPLIGSIVNKTNWSAGNSISFKVTANSGNLDITSREGDEAASPRLIVYYQAERQAAGAQNRSKIQQIVDELYAVGDTPIVEAMYEASNYMRGEAVDYGLVRGSEYFSRRWYRVSHPGSYEGGEVSRPYGCNDGDLNATSCAEERINTSPAPVYKSPITSQCQSNHIVLLSDGAATSNNAVEKVEKKINETCSTSHTYGDRCGRELASWLKNYDQSDSFAGEQFITTHTIGFNLNDPTFLQGIANAGGGTFEPANSASELLVAFKKIFNNVSQRNASFVAPGATVSQFNRLRNRNDVYYAMFKPSGTARWSGNLKRYRIGEDNNNKFALFDANGDLAIDESSGTFDTNSKSFWSSKTDGDDVEIGGAAEQIQKSSTSYDTRKVYTYTGTSNELTHATNRFDYDNKDIDISWLNLPAIVEADADRVQELMDWSRGRDLADDDGDGNTDEVRDHMGDPMHSVPVVANYANGESVIYLATNEGYMHAIDADSGNEHYAFIPKELLKNLYKFYRNDSTRNRPYGLDGGKMLWHEDTDQDGVIDTDETAILYIGMRRGGDSYYALDVSTYNQPKYLWSIKGGLRVEDTDDSTANGDYEELGSTWSLPVKTKILDGSTVKDVIIFGGGYDPNQDPANEASVVTSAGASATDPADSGQVRTTDSIGRAIFIADAETGELIWKTRSTDPRFSDMLYSIPSQVRPIDINFDGIIDQLYVGDMGGQIWRMDFDNTLVSTDSIDSRINAGKIAELAGDTAKSNRKFYYPPDVAIISINGRQLLTLSIGSGWRAHPLDDVVEDRFYSLRSPYVYGPPIDSFGVLSYDSVTETTSGLIDVTDDINAAVGADAKGWFIRMERSGEKFLSSSLTFNNQILVTSYLPAIDSDACDAAIGSGSLYGLSLYNGAPILNLDGNGSEESLTKADRNRFLDNSGLPPEVSVLFPEVGDNNSTVFQVGKETINDIDAGNTSKTTFWQEVSEGHD